MTAASQVESSMSHFANCNVDKDRRTDIDLNGLQEFTIQTTLTGCSSANRDLSNQSHR